MDLFRKFFGGGARSQPPQEPRPRVLRRAYCPGEVLCDEYVGRLLLGHGGMGEVYLVDHSGSGNLCAAKVMRVRRNATDADLFNQTCFHQSLRRRNRGKRGNPTSQAAKSCRR